MLRPGELKIAAKLPADGCAPAEAQAYTRWLAGHHYENFNVASWLLPKELRQHFYNLYAYCRWADDLGDEIPVGERAQELLDWWEGELNGCYEGRPSHPVFVALRETIVAKDVPKQPFADLLKAFRQDQVVKRYPTWDAVLDYCVYSANPVGRLVLYLCGYRDEERQRLSDSTCTALQLANFWQDVVEDAERGRRYVPADAMLRYGVDEGQIEGRVFTPEFRSMMQDLVARTREMLLEGGAISGHVDRELAVTLDLFRKGGEAILNGIAAENFDVLRGRPVVSKARKARLLMEALVGKLRAGMST